MAHLESKLNLKKFKLYETSGLKKEYFSFDDFSNSIGTPNILLIGFKNCGKSLFELAVNQTTINAKENMKITIVDRKISNIIEEYKATIRELKKVANIELIDGDINHIQLYYFLLKIVLKVLFLWTYLEKKSSKM